jgi:hypothetical protein
MQDEILPKESNKGKNPNFLNPKELEFFSFSFGLRVSTYVPT